MDCRLTGNIYLSYISICLYLYIYMCGKNIHETNEKEQKWLFKWLLQLVCGATQKDFPMDSGRLDRALA